MVSPSRKGVREPLQDHNACSIAKHCAGGVSVKRTAVSVLGEGSAILIQKSAPLRDADIYAPARAMSHS